MAKGHMGAGQSPHMQTPAVVGQHRSGRDQDARGHPRAGTSAGAAVACPKHTEAHAEGVCFS